MNLNKAALKFQQLSIFAASLNHHFPSGVPYQGPGYFIRLQFLHLALWNLISSILFIPIIACLWLGCIVLPGASLIRLRAMMAGPNIKMTRAQMSSLF